MNFQVVYGFILRHLYLYKRNWIRLTEILFWPAMELILWGFMAAYIEKQTTGDFSLFIRFLIGATIFWDVLFRTQLAVSMAFLEDMWTRNLLNVFVAPIRIREYLMGSFILALLRITIIVTVLTLLARWMYSFDLLEFQWTLVPFFGLLLVFGFSLGLISTSIVLRFGQAAESLAWAIAFLIQPFSAVFYSVDTLPQFMQYISWLLPSTYVFESMRKVLQTGIMDWDALGIAALINIGFLFFSATFFVWMFSQARERGLLTKIASQ